MSLATTSRGSRADLNAKFRIPDGACPFVESTISAAIYATRQRRRESQAKNELFIYRGGRINGRIDIVRAKAASDTTIIESEAFCECTELWRVNLCNAIVINDHAFRGCRSLDRLRFCTVNKIGHSAFKLCTSLEVVLVESSFTVIYYWAFAHCDSLKWVKFSDGIHHVSEGSFYCCQRLFNIGVPKNSFIIDWGRNPGDAPICRFLGNSTMTSLVSNEFTLVSAKLGGENSPLNPEVEDSINRIIHAPNILLRKERVLEIRAKMDRIRMKDSTTWLILAIRKCFGVEIMDVESVIISGALLFLESGGQWTFL